MKIQNVKHQQVDDNGVRFDKVKVPVDGYVKFQEVTAKELKRGKDFT